MLKIKDIIEVLEAFAPPAYQESYDNSGLLVGNQRNDVKNILITLDTTEAVVDEAISEGCNLIISHHPIIFRGIKKLTGSDDAGRAIVKAIKNDISIYAAHTNLDSVHNGVNKMICDRLELGNTQVLSPTSHVLSKLTTFCPTANTEAIIKALGEAGAGQIGKYKNCSFRTGGTGTFLPGEGTSPHIGEPGKLEEVEEDRIEVIFPTYLQSKVLKTLKAAHPYEEVAYYLHQLENENLEVGAGMIGSLVERISTKEFLYTLKKKFDLEIIRHTAIHKGTVKKIAVCGGSGSFLLSSAIAQQADVFISADFKYHEFFNADGKIMIADIGHYESEKYTKELFYKILSENFPNIALRLSKVDTNPIKYF